MCYILTLYACVRALKHSHRNGVVRYESVMALKTKLDKLGEMEGIAPSGIG